MGAQGDTTAPTCRSASHFGLSVRRNPSGVGQGRRADDASCRYRGACRPIALQSPAGQGMNARLARRARAIILMDKAEWHTMPGSVLPANISITFLPPRPPELNPPESIRQYLRQNRLSNRDFETHDAIVEAACKARKKLTRQPETITSSGMRKCAHERL